MNTKGSWYQYNLIKHHLGILKNTSLGCCYVNTLFNTRASISLLRMWQPDCEQVTIIPNFWRITHTGLHIKKNSIFGHYSGLNSRSNSGPIFDSISSRIPLDPLAVYSSTTVYIYKLLLPDSSKTLTFILKYDSGSSKSSSIHQIYDSTSPWLRTQPWDIRLVDKCRVATPSCRNLNYTIQTDFNRCK